MERYREVHEDRERCPRRAPLPHCRRPLEGTPGPSARRRARRLPFAVDGVPVHPQKIADTFAVLQDAFRVDRPNLKRLRFYDVRHTAITLWLKAGVDLRLVSRMAGHSSMYFSADTYAEVLGSYLDDAAAKMATLFG